MLTSLARLRYTRSVGLLWMTEVLLLAGVAAVSGYFAATWFDEATPRPAGSDFNGGIVVFPDTDGPPVDVLVQVPGYPDADGGYSVGVVDLASLAKAQHILYMIIPRGDSEKPFSMDVVLHADARIVADVYVDGGTYTVEESDGTQVFHVKVQPRDNTWNVVVAGRPAERTVTQSGAQIFGTMPWIDATDGRRSGGVPANSASGYTLGRLPATATLSWSSKAPATADLLQWQAGENERRQPLQFKIVDQSAEQASNRKLFLAAALIGVAGGAAIELIARLPEPLTAVAGNRGAARGRPGPGSTDAPKAVSRRRSRMSVKATALPAVKPRARRPRR